MKLQRFNCFDEFIELDEQSGACVPLRCADDVAVRGVGDIVSGVCVALVGSPNGLLLFCGSSCFDTADAAFVVRYSHLADGSTRFEVQDSNGSDAIVYPSWWHTTSQVAGLADNDDAEHDFCAYASFMLAEKTRRDFINKRYV